MSIYFHTETGGEPAVNMVRYCGSSREWAEKVIENAKTGDIAHAALDMARYCGSSREWAQEIVARVRA